MQGEGIDRPQIGFNRGRMKPLNLLTENENGVADGIRTRNNKLHKLGLYH